MLSVRDQALDLLHFIDRSPTAFHAARSTAAALEEAGFHALDEREEWALAPGDKRFVVRNDASIIAFIVGDDAPFRSGFRIVGAHTDSPGLKLKPNARVDRHGSTLLAAEPYGALLMHTWLDRDLTLAGRVMVADPVTGTLHSHLVDFQVPIVRIPSLAIHLDREVNTNGLVLNAQQHLVPVLGIARGGSRDRAALASMIAAEIRRSLGVEVQARDITEFDLFVVDTQKGALGGEDECFLFSARLDNLASCHAALTALLQSVASAPRTPATRVIAFWDNEECGSRSMHGAAGPFLRQVLERIVDTRSHGAGQSFARSMAASFLVSADMAHAVHPNYADKHDPAHAPLVGKGPVIKSNANQSYASDAESAGLFISLCRSCGFEPQRFVVRSDLPCGSTIGPVTAALMGIRTVDVGSPMLSMHSIREMAGVDDHAQMIAVLSSFFAQSTTKPQRSARARRPAAR